MADLVPPIPQFLAFVVASLLLAVTPGPGVFYIVTRSIMQGRGAGLASVLGVGLGNLGSAVAASLGLAAVLTASNLLFEIVRYAGAGYLFYLGWKALRCPAPQSSLGAEGAKRQGRLVLDGFVVALLNPKTALFFAAFLPQFVVQNADTPLQLLLLATLFVLIAGVTDTLYALCASAAANHLTNLRGGKFVAGGAYFGIGLLAAFTGNRGNS